MIYLPDIIGHNLKIVFVGFNPSLFSADVGHHYASRSNRFWKVLHLSGLTPFQLKPDQDRELLKYGYGSINIVDRPTRRADEIIKEEYLAGRESLKQKLGLYKPKIACYVGLGVYRELTGEKDIKLGPQSKSVVEGVLDYVCTSTSGLNTKPLEEQVECFKGLKKCLLEVI